MIPGFEVVLGKLIEIGYAEISKIQEAASAGATVSTHGVQAAIQQHHQEILRWVSGVTAGAYPHSRRTQEVTIDLDLQLTPRKLQLDFPGRTELKVSDLISFSGNIALLGDPGAGKTTSIKQLAQNLLARRSVDGIPLLVRLRDVQGQETLIERLQSILGLGMQWATGPGISRESAAVQQRQARFMIVSRFIDHLGCVVLLDGLDELEPGKRTEVLGEFRQLALSGSRARYLLTCRSGDFHYTIDNCHVVELSALDDAQIHRFVRLWLGKHVDVATFLAALQSSPYRDTAVRPLTLAHLCTLYAKYQKIPDKPRSVYRLIVNLLLEEWDASRSVERSSKFDHFDSELKREFLAHMAYQLTQVSRRAAFTHVELMNAYGMICDRYDLPRKEGRAVVSEIEAHSGLLVQSSYETYEFAHKSLQEYLTADFIIKLPSLPRSSRAIREMPHEFAVAVALSSDPSAYLSGLTLGPMTHPSRDNGYLGTFLHRLLLEKPDFNPTSLLGIAVLYLSSKLLETQGDSENFERVLESLYSDSRIRTSLMFVTSFYQLVRQDEHRLVYRWQKRLTPHGDAELPAEIEIRTSASSLRAILLETP